MCRAATAARREISRSTAGETKYFPFGDNPSKSKHRDVRNKDVGRPAALFLVSINVKSSLFTDDNAIILPLWIKVVAQNSLRGGAKMHRDVPEILRSVSWDDLRVFLTSADQSSFRKAAKILKINSATIVRRIERLEQVIGCHLFVRHTDGVSATAEGRMVMDHARTMERALFNIVRQSQISLGGIRGLVRVAITEGLAPIGFCQGFSSFRKPTAISHSNCKKRWN